MATRRQPSSAEAELNLLRNEIDRFDGWMLSLLRARGEVVMEIAKLKRCHGIRTRDPDREEDMLARLTRVSPSPFSAAEIREIFQTVFHACLRLQDPDQLLEETTNESERKKDAR